MRAGVVVAAMAATAVGLVDSGASCTQSPGDKCSCTYIDTYGDSSVWDISGLDMSPTQSWLTVKQAGKDFWFYYNPCTGISSDPTGCNDESVCQTGNADPTQNGGVPAGGVEGSPDSFDVDAAGNVVLTYTSSPRTSVVTFVCDQSVTTAQLDSATEDSAYHYRLQVTSDKACPKAPPAPPAPPPPGPGQTTTRPRPAPVGHPKDGAGLSAGSVLLLVFFLGTTSVFAIGASYRYKVRGLRGRELIVARDFWPALPGLAKDGVVFTWSKLGSLRGGYSTV